jgi:hypothetical protein
MDSTCKMIIWAKANWFSDLIFRSINATAIDQNNKLGEQKNHFTAI